MDSLYVHPFIFTTNKLQLIFCLYILFFSNFSITVHSRTLNKANVKQNSVIMLTIFVKDWFVNYSRLGCFCRYRTTSSFSCLWETVFWLRFGIVLSSVYTQAFSSRRLDLARNVTSPSWEENAWVLGWWSGTHRKDPKHCVDETRWLSKLFCW